jgi:hypothetical protein
MSRSYKCRAPGAATLEPMKTILAALLTMASTLAAAQLPTVADLS